jgi:hypothetical protein
LLIMLGLAYKETASRGSVQRESERHEEEHTISSPFHREIVFRLLLRTKPR